MSFYGPAFIGILIVSLSISKLPSGPESLQSLEGCDWYISFDNKEKDTLPWCQQQWSWTVELLWTYYYDWIKVREQRTYQVAKEVEDINSMYISFSMWKPLAWSWIGLGIDVLAPPATIQFVQTLLLANCRKGNETYFLLFTLMCLRNGDACTTFMGGLLLVRSSGSSFFSCWKWSLTLNKFLKCTYKLPSSLPA